MALVELVYVPEHGAVFHKVLPFVLGMTAADVLRETRFFEIYPDMLSAPVGVFSVQISYETVLKPGDRLEVYRPLDSDPKEKRRVRARR